MTVVFAGTFDPFSLGHKDIAVRAAKVFGSLIIAVAKSDAKRSLFSMEERIEITRKSVSEYHNIEVAGFEGLLTDFCKERNAKILVRGIRTSSDLEYETSLSVIYKDCYPGVESVFFITEPKYSHIRGKIIRELISLNADISGMVDGQAISLIKQLCDGKK